MLFVNGLPLAVIELKNATDGNATVRAAFQRLQTYNLEIPLAVRVQRGVDRVGWTGRAHRYADRRSGVVQAAAHVSGETLSGPSLPQLQNRTVVVLTDRNDLDDQLFTTFSRCADLLRQPLSRPRAGPTCGRSSRWSPAAWCSRSSSRRRRATAAPHAEALRIRDVGFDWILRGNVRAHLRRLVSASFGSTATRPKKQEAATRTVLEQAEVLSTGGAA